MQNKVKNKFDFDSITGNKAAISMLQNTIDNGNIAPAYLFSGISGIGKFTTAKLFAQNLVSSNIEILIIQDSIKIERIHEAIRFASIKPAIGNRKAIIIDAEVRLSERCSNALLKLLEEPSPQLTIIIVSSCEVLPTIKSRCQVIEFLPLSKQELSTVINYQYNNVEENIIQAARGSVKNALELIEAWDIISPFIDKLSIPPTSILEALNCSREIAMLDFQHQILLLHLLAATWWNNGNREMLQKATIAKSYLDCKVTPPNVWDNLLIP